MESETDQYYSNRFESATRCPNGIVLLVVIFSSFIAGAQTNSPDNDILSIRSIGAVRLGMTVQEASTAGGAQLKRDESMGGSRFVFYATKDAYFYVGAKDGRLHMACARSGRVLTSHGIRIGDSAKKLKQLPHRSLKIVRNHYELQPTDPQDRGYVMWFEVNGAQIDGICTARSSVHSYIMQGGV